MFYIRGLAHNYTVSKFFGSVNEINPHNIPKQSDLALEKYTDYYEKLTNPKAAYQPF